MLGRAKGELIVVERNRGTPVVLTDDDVTLHRSALWQELQDVWPLKRISKASFAAMKVSVVSPLVSLTRPSLSIGDEELSVSLLLRQFDGFLAWLGAWWDKIKTLLLEDWDVECDGPTKWRRFGLVDKLVRRRIEEVCDELKTKMKERVEHIVQSSVDLFCKYEGPFKPLVTSTGSRMVDCADLFQLVSFWLVHELVQLEGRTWLHVDEFTSVFGVEADAKARATVVVNQKQIEKIVHNIIALGTDRSESPKGESLISDGQLPLEGVAEAAFTAFVSASSGSTCGGSHARPVDFLDPSLCTAAVQKDGMSLRFVLDQSPHLCLLALQQNGMALQLVVDQTPVLCQEAVYHNGLALEFVKVKTPELCQMAVSRNGLALEFVKVQTPMLCQEAVNHNGLALEFVKVQTPELCQMAVFRNALARKFVKVFR
jgi:hypothetical protein